MLQGVGDLIDIFFMNLKLLYLSHLLALSVYIETL
jgi:hypothetical protein